MDIPRPRPKPTWRDSIWWHATEQSLISALMIMVLALPLVAYLALQAMALSHQSLHRSDLLFELAMGGLMMLPYLWAYYFALERIRRQGKDN